MSIRKLLACVRCLAVAGLVLILAGAAYVYLGLYPIGADTPHNAATYWLLESVRDMAQAWNEELDLMRALSIEAASRTTSRKPSKDSPKPLEGEALPPSPKTSLPELSSLGAEKPSELTNN